MEILGSSWCGKIRDVWTFGLQLIQELKKQTNSFLKGKTHFNWHININIDNINNTKKTNQFHFDTSHIFLSQKCWHKRMQSKQK